LFVVRQLRGAPSQRKKKNFGSRFAPSVVVTDARLAPSQGFFFSFGSRFAPCFTVDKRHSNYHLIWLIWCRDLPLLYYVEICPFCIIVEICPFCIIVEICPFCCGDSCVVRLQ
jgi:hypothetical protein